MYGVALEGGGTKGAYHVGALKAIFENGFEVGAFVGTSIGAFNAAVTAQGDFVKLYELWYSADSTMAIDMDVKELEKISDGKVDINSIRYWSSFLTKNLSSGGIDISNLRKVYSAYIDEEKLRKSNVGYGTVIVSITDKKPIYACKENMAEGKIIDYVLASSNLPVFKQEKLVDGKRYIDGGFYDNCPVQLLKDMGYKDIFEIHTEAIGVRHRVSKKGMNVYLVSPSKELGSILFTDNKVMRRNIMMGYLDTLRVIKGYLGKEYYVVPMLEDEVFKMLCNLSDENILELAKYIRLPQDKKNMEPKKILFENILPYISKQVVDKDTSTYQKLLVAVLEKIGSMTKLDEYKLYSFNEILSICKDSISSLIHIEEKAIIKNMNKLLLLKFIQLL